MNATTWLGDPTIYIPLYSNLMPILVSLNIVVHMVILLVLSRPVMKSPTNTLLKMMSVCDILTIAPPAPWYLIAYTLGEHSNMSWTSFSCFLYELLLETTPQMFHTATIWLTLSLAITRLILFETAGISLLIGPPFRYIYVCYPNLAKLYCTERNMRNLSKILFFSAILHNIPRVMDREYNVLKIGKI